MYINCVPKTWRVSVAHCVNCAWRGVVPLRHLKHVSPPHRQYCNWLKPCPHCRKKVRLSRRRKVRLSPFYRRFRRQSQLLCDSLTFLRQCGQGFIVHRTELTVIVLYITLNAKTGKTGLVLVTLGIQNFRLNGCFVIFVWRETVPPEPQTSGTPA